ncbi:hypothetical protein OIE62_33490 [Streptomyces scopuliridis]|uniref:Uncharacterized protein n=2 Tax=Streptomyces scopuliridis TaxID=452529 RepID=A0A2T7SQM3_9ACTN|nr:hypothetical protein [Streptomyces scopuliridis]PVE05279.1 hypothetical protein Y717_02110 [Streptomyces scopuliridis RB72]WSB32602.1 hypothetical protein OG949_06850 [Streptomyces scopuliridis]WSB96848.1 hypothetical protein OG835_07445 [Streptomyces scopuliridis]WSC09448.1 hypothetical protein OIE62_33490 [Streptomyces scopuliridis]
MTTTTSLTSSTSGECTAARAYLRLLAAVRAVLDDPLQASLAAPLLAAPIAEADEALRAAGLAGNEREFLHLVAAQALAQRPHT